MRNTCRRDRPGRTDLPFRAVSKRPAFVHGRPVVFLCLIRYRMISVRFVTKSFYTTIRRPQRHPYRTGSVSAHSPLFHRKEMPEATIPAARFDTAEGWTGGPMRSQGRSRIVLWGSLSRHRLGGKRPLGTRASRPPAPGRARRPCSQGEHPLTVSPPSRPMNHRETRVG